jgi:hypothetical protein
MRSTTACAVVALFACGSSPPVTDLTSSAQADHHVHLQTAELFDVMDEAIHPPGAGGRLSGNGSGADQAAGVGRVIAINPQAEYVTRTALTEEERADLLFGVKVAIDDPAGRFKPGLPVTVRLSLRGSATP